MAEAGPATRPLSSTRRGPRAPDLLRARASQRAWPLASVPPPPGGASRRLSRCSASRGPRPRGHEAKASVAVGRARPRRGWAPP